MVEATGLRFPFPMQSEAIFATLASAAAFLKKPIQDVAAHSLKDFYEKTKGYLRTKFGAQSDATAALEKLEEKPESEARKAVLIEETAALGLESDGELARLVEQLAALLAAVGGTINQVVSVKGRGNKVLVAGRDIINTKKHVQRNEITPDERHITAEQREKVREVIAELAMRLAGENGEPNFAAVHVMLRRRFNVPSYNLILRGQYEEALSFLKQQRAINRSRLRRRNPVAYQNDFYRGIWARQRALGWEKARVYEFAAEKLALKKPITSLKELGSIQLKTLAEFMQREERKSRSSGDVAGGAVSG